MPHFKYIAVNKDNAKLQGTIQSGSVDAARQELNNLGLSVLDIQKIAAPEKAASGRVFEFTALDTNGKSVSGTIKSTDEKKAFQRLTHEYGLAVQTISSQGKAFNIQELQTAQPANQPKPQEQSTEDSGKKLLEETVKNTADTVYELLKNKGDLIKPEFKASIKKQVDKLLLIKSSSNTDFVKNTCTELLKKIQNPEIYIEEHKTAAAQEATQKTSKIVYGLEHQPVEHKEFLGKTITKQLQTISKEKLEQNSSFLQRFKQQLATSILEITEDPPEIQKIKSQLATLKSEFWYYVKQWFIRSKEREQMSANIAETRKKIADKKSELAKAKERQKVYKSAQQTTTVRPLAGYLIALNTFTGWLLGFYLFYYFIAYMLTYKNIMPTTALWNFNVFEISLLKKMILLTFIIHMATSIKIVFFRYSRFSGMIIFSITILSAALLLVNV